METNCVTLETAKKLKAAKFPQETFAAWSVRYFPGKPDPFGKVWTLDEQELDLAWKEFNEGYYAPVYAAPTAQEIADQLPHFTAAKLANGGFSAIPTRNSSQYYVSAATLAEALATLWLALHEALPSNSGLEGQEGPMPSHD